MGMTIRPIHLLSALAALAFVLGPLPAAASAAWPGKNGRIVFRMLELGFEAEGQEPEGLAWTSARRGEAPHRLTADPTDQDPQVSPDGRLISFSRQAEPQPPESAVHTAVFLIRFDHSELRQLTFPPEECSDRKASFDPRGTRLIFIRHCRGTERRTDTWSIGVDGINLRRLEGPQARSSASVISPTGQQVIFVRRGDEPPHLISMRPDGSRRRDLTPSLGREQSVEGPDFSPSGRAIVFGGGFAESDLFTMRANGRRLKRLNYHPSSAGHSPPRYAEPAFSPDGREVVAIEQGRSGPASLVRFEIGGDGHPRGVPQVRYGDMPVWAPAVTAR
jgi:Tol biopolymer transport system component